MKKYEESQDDDRTYRHAEEHGVHGPQIHLREAGSRTSSQALQIIPIMQHRNKMSKIQANQICIIQYFIYFHVCFAIESLNWFDRVLVIFAHCKNFPQMMDAQLDDMDDQQRAL